MASFQKPEVDSDSRTLRKKETAEWLNPLIHRFWENIRVNQELLGTVKEKIRQKLQFKLQEKKLDAYLVDLKVTDVDVGDTLPHLLSVKVLEPLFPGEVVRP